MHVVVAGYEEEILLRHLAQLAETGEELLGKLELFLQALATIFTQVTESGIAGEEDQVRAKAVLPLQAVEVLAEGVKHASCLPAAAGTAAWRSER